VLRGRLSTVLRLIALLALTATLYPASAVQRTQFDHLTTGYELRGAHRDLACEYCHVGGVFKGTPRACEGCHMSGTRVSATLKPATHITSANNCDACHAIYNFKPVVSVDHSMTRGSCFSCHNGSIAKGKTPDHIPADNNCDACHTTVAFSPQRMDHTATSAAAKRSCRGCHTGVRAATLSRSHIQTTAECGDCHTTLSWTPARFNHSMVSGSCQSCHNGASALGKVAGHMTTTRDCSTCHRYPNWTPVIFVHSDAQYPGDHRASPACTACHTTNSDQASWQFASFRGTCAGCHANSFKPDAHDRTAGGIKYTASELQNCTGACHIYTDATLGSIAKARPAGRHKVTDGAFH
jgi:hypothetical protein